MCSTDYFIFLTDPSICNKEGYRKNVDDILTSAKDVRQLEDRLKKLLMICRKKNMKISPSKFQVGPLWSLGVQSLKPSTRGETPREQS